MAVEKVNEFDICIIGGGLVGSCLAIVCDKLGLKTALVEQKNLNVLQPDDPLDMRHIALSHGSKKIFEGLDIWQQLQSYAHSIDNIHVSDQGHFGFTRLSAQEQAMPALGYVIPYHDFQKILSQQLQQCQYVTYYTDASVIASSLIHERWQMTIEKQKEQYIATAKLLIGADGVNSALRENYQIKTVNKSYQQTAIVTTVRVSKQNLSTAYERFTAEGPMAILPAGDDYCALIWTVDMAKADNYLAQTDNEFIHTVQQAFGYRVGKFLAIGKRQSFPLNLVISDEQIKPRLLLLGNAVHNLHPIAAQGFNLALRDIAGLCDVFKKYKNDVGQSAALTMYANERQQDQKRTLRFTDGLVLLFSNNFLPLVKLRNSLMLILDLYQPAKAWIGRYGAGRLGKISSLARGEKL